MKKVLEVGVLLSSERDLDRLLERILVCVMELAPCDAGTLYLREGDTLRFKIMRNNTLKTFSGGDGKDPDLPPVPLKRENVCALSFLEDQTICIEDVRSSNSYDFSGPIRYDAMTGYHTQSMLVVPMRNRSGEKLGVVQLINALDENGNVCPFRHDMILVLESLGSQAAIAIQNMRYIREIKELFQSFVRMMSSAIDQRSPYNGSHTRHMAAYGGHFLDYLNEQARAAGKPEPYPPEQKEELLMSVWLHDIGKLVTPLEIMNKTSRLLPEQYTAFMDRMEIIRLRGQVSLLSGKCTAEELELLKEETRKAARLVEKTNISGFITEEKLSFLRRLAERTYTGEDGRPHPWITQEELHMLSIRKGTLSPEERKIMEKHVEITDRLLTQIHFSPDLSHVREWAAGHHELLDGSGYPHHLTAKDIPKEVRIITILDIFDALVADDRPYKPGMPVDQALAILDAMAREEGKLDIELTEQFIKSKCWERMDEE